MKNVIGVQRQAHAHWVGDGFPVRTIFSYHTPGLNLSPFLLLDYMGPADFPPSDRPRGVEEHPHRGFETVTIVYQGELEHRDSAGNAGRIGPGDVQWMTAGGGVLHEEMHGRDFTRRGGTLEGVQLWVNLPARSKMTPPRYQTLLARDIPTVSVADGRGGVRVIAGTFKGAQGPAVTFTPVQLWDLRLPAGGRTAFRLPDGSTTGVLVRHGTLRANGTESVGPAELVVFDRSGEEISLEAETDTEALLLNGAPIDEPVVGYGPFVMNTREEIQQAVEDFRAGKFGRLVTTTEASPG